MAELYGAFGKLLPHMAPFWDRLVGDERAHAEVIRALAARVLTDRLLMKPRNLSREGIERSIGAIERQIREAQASGVTSLRALTVALGVEKGMLEKRYFETFEADSEEMKAEFDALREHTEEHARRIEERLAGEQPAPPSS